MAEVAWCHGRRGRRAARRHGRRVPPWQSWAGRSAGVRPKSAAAAVRLAASRRPPAPGARRTVGPSRRPASSRRRQAGAADSSPPLTRSPGSPRPAAGRRILGTSPGPAWPGLSLRLPLPWRPCGCWTLRLASAAHPDGDGCAQTPRRPQGRRRAPERWRLDSSDGSAPDTGTPGAGRRGGGPPRWPRGSCLWRDERRRAAAAAAARPQGGGGGGGVRAEGGARRQNRARRVGRAAGLCGADSGNDGQRAERSPQPPYWLCRAAWPVPAAARRQTRSFRSNVVAVSAARRTF